MYRKEDIVRDDEKNFDTREDHWKIATNELDLCGLAIDKIFVLPGVSEKLVQRAKECMCLSTCKELIYTS